MTYKKKTDIIRSTLKELFPLVYQSKISNEISTMIRQVTNDRECSLRNSDYSNADGACLISSDTSATALIT